MKDCYDKLGEQGVGIPEFMQYQMILKQHLQNIPCQKEQYSKIEYSIHHHG